MTADAAGAPPEGPEVHTLAIIGTGLMGGSLGLAAIANGAAG